MNMQNNIQKIINSNAFLIELAQSYLIYGYNFSVFYNNNNDLSETEAHKIWDTAKRKLEVI